MTSKRLIQLFVSVAVLGVLFYFIDLDQARAAFAAAEPAWLALALLIASVNRVLMAVKWNMLLRVKGIRISFYEATRFYYVSSFWGLLLPPTVGADLLRACMVKRRVGRLRDVLASIVVERVLGLVVLLLFGAVGCVLFFKVFAGADFDAASLLGVVVVLAAAVVGVFVFSLSQVFRRVLMMVLQPLRRRGRLGRFASKLRRLYRSYRAYRLQPGTLLAFFGLTCVENLLPIARPFIVALAFNIHIPIECLFVIVPIELILIRLPISLDGFGIREGVFVFFLSLIGVGQGIAFSIAITNHLLFLIALAPGGFFRATTRQYRQLPVGS